MLKKLRKNVFAISLVSVILTVTAVICGFYFFFVNSFESELLAQGFSGEVNAIIAKEFLQSLVFIVPFVLLVLFVDILLFRQISKRISSTISDFSISLDGDDDSVYDELRPLIRRFREQKKKQKEVDRIKRQFTANVSHELKTPLTSIAGYAELIENGMAQGQDITKFASIINHECQRLIHLTKDIVQLSQLDESEELPQAKEISTPIDLYSTSQNCIEALSLRAEKKGISMKLLGESCTINGNPSLIEDLIYNLCENAIRYNKENGSVTISVGFDGNNSILKIADTGIGIPEKYQERVFERFYTVDRSRSKATGGTGLGLAIVKHIVEYHGASLEIESKEDSGTIITIRFKD